MQPTGTMGTDTHTHIGICPCVFMLQYLDERYTDLAALPVILGERHHSVALLPFKSPLTLRTAAAPPNRNRMSLRFTCFKQYSNADKEHHSRQ